MAAISSKVPALVQQSLLQASLSPAPIFASALTVKDLQNMLQEIMEKQLQQFVEILDKKLEEKLTEKRAEVMDEKITEKVTEIRADILSAFQGMAICIENLDERVEDLSQNDARLEVKMTETENVVEKIDCDLTSVQYYQMEFAIRVRGLKENPKENLKVSMV